MVKVIGHKTASPPQTDGSIAFSRWRQCALPCWHIGATWRIWLNFGFLRPTGVHNSNDKSIGSAVAAQLTAESPYTFQWDAPLPALNCPFPWGIWTPFNAWLSSQYGELRPTNGWDLFGSLEHPSKFQRVSRLGSVTVRHSTSGRQANFAALNRGRHLYSARRPSRWALAHILFLSFFLSFFFLFFLADFQR